MGHVKSVYEWCVCVCVCVCVYIWQLDYFQFSIAPAVTHKVSQSVNQSVSQFVYESSV